MQTNGDSPGRLDAPVRPADVLRELGSMYAAGTRTISAGLLAERLWPNGRTHNANGQVFPLAAGVAARMLRRCPAAREAEPRRWEILPHRLSIEWLSKNKPELLSPNAGINARGAAASHVE